MEKHNLLYERFDFYFKNQIYNSLSFQDVEVLKHQGIAISREIIENIEWQLKSFLESDDTNEAEEFLRLLAKKYGSYYKNQIIDEQTIFNLKVHCREYDKSPSSWYDRKLVLNELKEMGDVFHSHTTIKTKEGLVTAQEVFDRDTRKRDKYKLPFINFEKSNFLKILKKIEIEGNSRLFYDSIELGLNLTNLPPSIGKDYQQILIYDQECLISQLLWDILGLIYLRQEDLGKIKLNLSGLFQDANDYEIISKRLRQNLLDHTGNWRGLEINSIIDESKAIALAIQECLYEKEYLKKYTKRVNNSHPAITKPQQISAILKEFGLPRLSEQALRKKAKNHTLYLAKLRQIIPDRDNVLSSRY